MVVREETQVGEWLEQGGAVVELLSLEQLEVSLDLPERYFDALRPQTRARITFESLPGLEVEGVVRTIIPRADSQAGFWVMGLPSGTRKDSGGVLLFSTPMFLLSPTRMP